MMININIELDKDKLLEHLSRLPREELTLLVCEIEEYMADWSFTIPLIRHFKYLEKVYLKEEDLLEADIKIGEHSEFQRVNLSPKQIQDQD